MALFLTILEGDSADTARPILASKDSALIDAVSRTLQQRLHGESRVSAALELNSKKPPKIERKDSHEG
jgi:hypothetical protein